MTKKHHPNTINKAKKYVDNPNNFFQINIVQYNEFGEPVKVSKDDKDLINKAYLEGYKEARENSKLNWFDISTIIEIAFSKYPNLKEIDYDSQSVFQKIADIANKEIFGRHYI